MKPISNIIIAGAVLTIAGTAVAEPYVHNMLLRDGNNAGLYNRNGNIDNPAQNYYPGGEQAVVTPMADGRILMFGMGSYEHQNQYIYSGPGGVSEPGTPAQNRVQLYCASSRIDPIDGPVLDTMKYVTNNNGNRYRNAHHPRVVSIFGGDAAVVFYNYAPDDNVRTYAKIFDSQCNEMLGQTQIIAKNNDDCSNSETKSVKAIDSYGGPNVSRLVGIYGCNGNGEDNTWIGLVDVTRDAGDYAINVVNVNIVADNDEERSRGTVVVGPDESFFSACWSSGDNQPTDNGVRCGAWDTATGQRLWRTYVMRRQNNDYRTQILTTSVTDQAGNATDMSVATYQELTPRRGENIKGQVLRMGTALRFTREGMDIVREPTPEVLPTVDGTHIGQCSGLFGEEGSEEWRLFVVGGSVNGNPVSISTGQTVKWDESARTLTPDRQFPLNTSIDVAWLSNIYGQNPNEEGRNFVDCAGNIPNPGYGVTNGYQPDVKSFVAIAATSRRMDPNRINYAEDKLSTELILVPATYAVGAPAPGVPVDPDQTDPTDPDPEDPSEPGPGGGGVGSSGGCAVSGGAGLGSLAFLGLALLIGARRREGR